MQTRAAKAQVFESGTQESGSVEGKPLAKIGRRKRLRIDRLCLLGRWRMRKCVVFAATRCVRTRTCPIVVTVAVGRSIQTVSCVVSSIMRAVGSLSIVHSVELIGVPWASKFSKKTLKLGGKRRSKRKLKPTRQHL